MGQATQDTWTQVPWVAMIMSVSCSLSPLTLWETPLGQRLCAIYLCICSIYETVQGHSRCLINISWTERKTKPLDSSKEWGIHMKNETVSMCLILCTPFPFLFSVSLMHMLTKYDPNLIPVRQMPRWLAVGIPGSCSLLWSCAVILQVTDVEWDCVGAEVVLAISITVRSKIQGN